MTVDVSERTEMTDAPWWVIIDPKGCRPDLHSIAKAITGPFFSREEAQAHLEARYYEFSKRAAVYCKSGYWTREYKGAYDAARARFDRQRPKGGK